MAVQGVQQRYQDFLHTDENKQWSTLPLSPTVLSHEWQKPLGTTLEGGQPLRSAPFSL
jgi:hypothetical protein